MGADRNGTNRDFWQDFPKYHRMILQLASANLRTAMTYGSALFKYQNEFMQPYWIALDAFLSTEKDKLMRHPPADSFRDYFERNA